MPASRVSFDTDPDPKGAEEESHYTFGDSGLYIWVCFLRTGIGYELCDFFKKFGWLL